MEEFVQHLRDEHRLKLNCDYCYRLKYGELHILAEGAYHVTLEEHFPLITCCTSIFLIEDTKC
jgi:hypothetical protein